MTAKKKEVLFSGNASFPVSFNPSREHTSAVDSKMSDKPRLPLHPENFGWNANGRLIGLSKGRIVVILK